MAGVRSGSLTGWKEIVEGEFLQYNDGIITHRLKFHTDSTWSGYVHNRPVPAELLTDVPTTPITQYHYRQISQLIHTLHACPGNTDIDSGTICNNVYKKIRNRTMRCDACAKVRRTLQQAKQRRASGNTDTRVLADSRTPLSVLSPPELKQRAANLSRVIDANNSMISRYKDKIQRISNSQSIKLVHNSDVSKLVQETVSKAPTPQFDSEIKKLFWQQQIKQNSLKCKKAMRWHPMTIRWALTFNSISAAGYDYVRESGAFALPHTNTLQRYVSFKEKSCGVLADNIAVLKSKLQDNVSDVALMHDEIKIKDKLVYNRASGELIGYVELGDINTALQQLESDSGSKKDEKQIATHALCFMARSLVSKNCMPVAQYATNCLTADSLFHMFWEVVAELEMNGINVRCSISDGAATNRKFYQLHHNDFPDDDVTYRCINPFSEIEANQTLFFISDVPHLLKTTRNCVENSHGHNNTRNLMVSYRLQFM